MSPFLHILPARGSRSGFSLVELLVVLGLIAVILALVVPAVLGMGKARAIDTGGNTLASLAARARQNSLTKNAMTALIVLGHAGSEADYRAVSLYELVPRPDGSSLESADWKPLNRWEILPAGVVIDQCSFGDALSPITPPFPGILFRGKRAFHYQYVVFMPGGALLRSEGARMRLVQGVIEPGAQSATLTGARARDGGPANFYEISIVDATGQVKVDRP